MLHKQKFESLEQIQKGFKRVQYMVSRPIATAVYLAFYLGKPILVEGPAGVGKTELSKAAADYMEIPLIRLQCYEGLDESKALYEWKYGKQLLYTQLLKDKLDSVLNPQETLSESIKSLHRFDDIFFSPDFLEPRPLLKALQEKNGAVLLVDEVDKADEEFEAFLLEVLSDYQVSIPEVGTVRARQKPFVFLTSNNTRELSEALKRRCIHLHIPFPDARLEREIVRLRVPGISARLETQLVTFIQEIRKMDLKKTPSISETLDWARSLLILHAESLNHDLVEQTMPVFLKYEDDIRTVRDSIHRLTDGALRASGG